MLMEQRPARYETQSAAVLGASTAAAALFTCWFAAQMGGWAALLVFPLALLVIVPVTILPALLLYRLAVWLQLANAWTAATAGLLMGVAIVLVRNGTLLGPAGLPLEALLFGTAGIVGGLAFWRGVRSETNAPDEPISPPEPSSAAR